MKNPYLAGSRENAEWEIKNNIIEVEEKLIKDMGKFISENITKIIYNEKGYLEVEIQLSNTSKYTKEQKEHYVFIEDMTQTIYVDTKQFLEWKGKGGK